MTTRSWLRSLLRPAHRRPAWAARLHLQSLDERVVPATTVYFDDFANGPAVDSAGNVYVYYSRLHGNVDLDPDPIRTSLVSGTRIGVFNDVSGRFLVKYSPDREVLWVKPSADLPGLVRGVTVVADAAGNESLYVFGSNPGWTGFITKMGLDGSVAWSRATATVANLVVDADGSLYGSATFSGTIDFDPGTDWADGRDILTGTSQSQYVARWAADGTIQWARLITSTASAADPGPNVWGGGIAVSAGAVYVGGMYTGNLNLGGLTNDRIDSASASPDGFLAAYDTSGNLRSVAHLVDAKPGFVRAAGSDVYVTANFGYTADLDPGAGQKLLTPGNVNGNNLAVARLTYDPAAPAALPTLAWAESFISTTGANLAGGLAVSGGDLYVSGSFGPSTDFDPDPARTYTLTPGGGQDVFVMRLSGATGGLGWVSQLGSAWRLAVGPEQEGAALALTPSGLYLGGHVAHGPVNFTGPDRATSKILDTGLDQDALVARLGTDGSHQWSFNVGAVGRTIDDGEPGYSETGSGWKTANLGWNADARTHTKGTGANTARWTFAGLPNGTYRVITYFPAARNYATNATFRLNGAPVVVNQTVAPNDVQPRYLEGTWEDLGTAAVTNGTLTVTLSDQAKATVVADVVRIWFEAPPPAPLVVAAAPSGTPSAGTLSAAQAKPLLAEALRRWGLAGADVSKLGPINLQVTDLPGRTLGQAQGRTITLDANAAGWGWFVDRTPQSDSEFRGAGDPAAKAKIDLLSVLTHEVGHLLGKVHEPHGVMAEALLAGVRELPEEMTSSRWGVDVRRNR